MTTLTQEEFETIIYSEDVQFISNYIIILTNRLNINLDNVITTFNLINLTFKGQDVRFYQRRRRDGVHNININNCTFHSDLNIDACDINEFNLQENNFNCANFTIINSNINDISIKENQFKSNFKINLSNFKLFEFEENKFEENTKFSISGNTKIEDLVTIVNCKFNQLVFSHCIFNGHFDFFRNSANNINTSSLFNKCEFNYSSFFETKFNNDTHFTNCSFLNLSKFEKTGDEIYTTLRFSDCNFSKQIIFNKSKIHKITFNSLIFNDIVSLQETYFDIISIDKTIFEKQALFDDIQIKQIYNCDTRTIRTIKQQLQKADNKIDYNKFRVYEFNAYREDIKKKLNEFKKDKNYFNHRKREPIQLKRDAFVLWLSDIVSEYGTDWKRAIKFTLLTGFLFFSIFFISENYNNSFDIENWQDFAKGYIRFFLITDFYNPLEEGRTYIKSFWSWIPFIFGKIFIAFGIYEMIQSFRKFKA